MKRTLLEVEFDTDYYIIGISCHLKDYRVGYWINKNLNLELSKKHNYLPSNENIEEQNGFSFYVQEDTENEIFYYLVANRGMDGLLIPEYKQCDYFFIIENPNPLHAVYQNALKTIKKIPSILTAFEVEYDLLKSKNRLIFQ